MCVIIGNRNLNTKKKRNKTNKGTRQDDGDCGCKDRLSGDRDEGNGVYI